MTNRCAECGTSSYGGFARCKNPSCRAIREGFLTYQAAIVNTEGICVFSGAPTDFRLPNGHYIWADLLLEYINQGWISEDLSYTNQFLEIHPHMRYFEQGCPE